MPDGNGYEVATALRAMEFGDRMLIIAITGWGTEQDRARSSAAGVDLHITKPADFPTLLAAVAGGRSDDSSPVFVGFSAPLFDGASRLVRLLADVAHQALEVGKLFFQRQAVVLLLAELAKRIGHSPL
jgi:DNA-binding response OmpR family regulator